MISLRREVLPKMETKPLFSKETNGKFFNDEKKIIGSSPWYKVSIGLFVFAVAVVITSITQLMESPYDPNQNSAFLYLHPEWYFVNLLPRQIAYTAWLFFIPLILSTIGFFSKKYSNTKSALTIISGSIAMLMIWVICLLIHVGFLI